jgi:signal transduction histidine kinase
VAEERVAEPLTEYIQRITRQLRAFDRRHPLVWDLLLTGSWVTAALIDYGGDGWRNIALNVDVPGRLLLTMSLRLSPRSLWWAATVFITPVVVTAVRHPHGSADQEIVPALLATVSAAAIGITVRTRRNYTEALEDRARRLETERDQQAQLATAAERARIAREMHDIIGHNLSVITGLADGGRYAATKSPERATQALTHQPRQA